MNEHPDYTGMKPVLTATLRLLIAFGGGLLLGTLGDALAWNRLENPWPYLGVFCPLLLGISVALTVGVRHRDACLSMVLASFLAWIGFYLTFIFIAFHGHPYQMPNPPQADSSQADSDCSPCFSSDFLSGFLILAFFPVGPFFVLLIAFVTSSLVRFVCWRRARPKSR